MTGQPTPVDPGPGRDTDAHSRTIPGLNRKTDRNDNGHFHICRSIRYCPTLRSKLSASFAGRSAVVANAAGFLVDRFPSALCGLSPL